MERIHIKIGELKFELIKPLDEEDMPVLEIENEASIIFETVDIDHAIKLRNLLDDFIETASDS